MQGQPCVPEPLQAVARRHGQASRTRGIDKWRRGCRGSRASPSPFRQSRGGMARRAEPVGSVNGDADAGAAMRRRAPIVFDPAFVPPSPQFQSWVRPPGGPGGSIVLVLSRLCCRMLGANCEIGGRGGRASRVPLFCPSTVVVNVALLVASWPKPRLGAKRVVGIYDNAFLYSVLPRWPMDNALMLVLPNCRRNLPQSESDWGRFSHTV